MLICGETVAVVRSIPRSINGAMFLIERVNFSSCCVCALLAVTRLLPVDSITAL